MKLSEAWLREWVNPPVSSQELLDQLTFAGLEVEACEPVAGQFSHIVVGEVLAVEPHPDAKKLNVCQVEVAQKEPLTIVCGAQNVAVGIKVPVALIGALLPNGMEIKPTQLRGVDSFGMLCSAQELGLEESSNGLFLLPNDAPIGTDLRAYLQLDDQLIELAITPNRGDCLSIHGLAREVSAINNLSYDPKVHADVDAEATTKLAIQLQASKACPRYLGRVIKQVNAAATTPAWLSERLRRAGIKSISLVVDILNYVMLELGQPMHAFDFNKLQGDINVRFAAEGECLELLNEETVELKADTLVIADQQGPQAIAGVMGGLASSVTTSTTDIFLESAYFEPTAIAGKAKQYGVVTDSAYRYERGVDFNLPKQAIERAAFLIIELAGGVAGPVVEAVSQTDLPERPEISLSLQLVTQLLNVAITAEQVIAILQNLGMAVQRVSEDELLVKVPSYRFDISIAEDLIEEIARIYGYDKIPVTELSSKGSFTLPATTITSESRVKQLLVDLGYHEAITYSFISSAQQQAIQPGVAAIEIANPISAEMAVMRTSLWPGLLATLKYNLHRQQVRAKLFEVGLRFSYDNQSLSQDLMLAGLWAGSRFPEQWGEPTTKADFFDLKGDVEQLLALTCKDLTSVEFLVTEHAALHPGQAAMIKVNGNIAGYLGALHPAVAQQLGIKVPVYLFELKMDKICASNPLIFRELSKFPLVRRDFAILVNKSVTSQCLQDTIRQECGELLVDITVFDVFTGNDIGESKRSVAISVSLQHPTRTLQDEEIVELSERVVNALRTNFDAELRE